MKRTERIKIMSEEEVLTFNVINEELSLSAKIVALGYVRLQ